MKPLFMWAGGKTKMQKHYKPYLPKLFDTYIEPFFGGGAMMIQALKINPKAKVVINDINPSIVNIYSAIKDNIKPFLEELDRLDSVFIPMNKEDRKQFYYTIRNEHAWDAATWSKPYEAARLYFLMKTGFNGIWQINKNTNNRFGTPSGLLTQKTSVYDRQNVLEWHRTLQTTTIMCGDYKDTLVHADENTWVFMDPPYRGGFTKYGVEFDDNCQREVVDNARWLTEEHFSTVWITNRDIGDDFFDEYKTMQRYQFDVVYTAGRRKKTEGGFKAKKAKEILLISSPSIVI